MIRFSEFAEEVTACHIFSTFTDQHLFEDVTICHNIIF